MWSGRGCGIQGAGPCGVGDHALRNSRGSCLEEISKMPIVIEISNPVFMCGQGEGVAYRGQALEELVTKLGEIPEVPVLRKYPKCPL